MTKVSEMESTYPGEREGVLGLSAGQLVRSLFGVTRLGDFANDLRWNINSSHLLIHKGKGSGALDQHNRRQEREGGVCGMYGFDELF